jgi:S1-C subfamily serine protease
MRVVTALGVAVCVLGMAAAVTLGAAPSSTMAGQRASQAAPQAEKKAEAKAGQGGGIYTPALMGGGLRLGIEIHDVTKEEVAALRLVGQNGVVVDAVTKDSAAEKAGLKAKDALVAYDGETVRSAQQLTRLVRETAPGRSVKIAVVRDGKRIELEAMPAEGADEAVSVFINSDQIRGDVEKQMQELRGQLNQYRFERRVPGPREDDLRFKMEGPPTGESFPWFGREGGPLEMMRAPSRGRLGVTVQELTPELAIYFGVKDGVLVSGVTPDSPAAKAGIRVGDVITAVHDKPVTSAGELVSQLGVTTGEVTIGLTRDKKPLTLKATIDAPKAPGRRVVLRGTPA